MYQAIITKYIGPSNVRGSRVKAIASAGSITLHWNSALNPEQNHTAAARALALKFGWVAEYRGGGMPDDSGYAFVASDPRDTMPSFAITAVDVAAAAA
jgi:hypothetical protein